MNSSVHLDTCRTLADGLDHPEGVSVAADRTTVYAGGEAGQVYRVGSGGDVDLVASTGGFALGLCLDGAGNVYVCDPGAAAVAVVGDGGAVHHLPNAGDGRAMRTPNAIVFDRAGRLIVSDSGDWKRDNGAIWLIEDSTVRLLRADVNCFPNGLALDEDRGFLYAVESTAGRIVRVPYRSGVSGEDVIEVVRLPPRTIPDGIALTGDGALVIGCYVPDVVYLATGSHLDVIIADWEHVTLASPTNVCFVGPQLDQLVIACFGGRSLVSINPGLRGAPLAYPVLEV